MSNPDDMTDSQSETPPFETYDHPPYIDTTIELPMGVGAAISTDDNGLPGLLCEQVIEYFVSHPDSLVTMKDDEEGPQAKFSLDAILSDTSSSLGFEDSRLLAELSDSVFDHLGEALNRYVSHYLDLQYLWDQQMDTGYIYSRYPKVKGYRLSRAVGGVHRALPQRERVIAAIMFLNTVDDGGGVFFDLHEWHCQPVQGRTLMFPANFHYPYVVLPSQSTDIHMLTTYFTAPSENRGRSVSENAQRAFTES